LTLTSNRDWTVKGVTTLTIWFRGSAGNAAETLYVALNGNAVVNNDNPDAALATDWTEWNIDLQAFGVNLANVNSIVQVRCTSMIFDCILRHPKPSRRNSNQNCVFNVVVVDSGPVPVWYRLRLY